MLTNFKLFPSVYNGDETGFFRGLMPQNSQMVKGEDTAMG